MPEVISRDEARLRGLTRFFTGVPCIHGHTAECYVSSGNCVVCARISGRRSDTRVERLEKKRFEKHERREADPEAYEAEKKIWSARQGERYRADPEYRAHRLALQLAWRQKNPEKWRAIQRRVKKTPSQREKVRAYRRRRRKERMLTDPEYALKLKSKARLHKARRKLKLATIEGVYTQADIDRIFKLQRGRCAYCRSKLKRYEIDHIVSLRAGGTNWPRNLQLTCVGNCNQRKGDAHPLDFAQRLGFLL